MIKNELILKQKIKNLEIIISFILNSVISHNQAEVFFQKAFYFLFYLLSQ